MALSAPSHHAWTRLRLVLALDLILVVMLACAFGPVEQHEWDGARGPVVPHDSFPSDCSLCHLTGSWTDLREDFQFDHGAETGVELRGAHAEAECLRCHNDRGPVAEFAARGCAGCHEDFHDGRLGSECLQCHDERTWRPTGVIAEHDRTRFPLVGAHALTECHRCHPGAEAGEFSPTPVECAACHLPDAEATSEPDHVALNWVEDCSDCHAPTSWTERGFVHTAWPLTGAHGQADCKQCHGGGLFRSAPRHCYACHSGAWQNVQDPPHAQFNFPKNCEQCHDTVTFSGAPFNHLGITTSCQECHLEDYLAAGVPDHQAAGFGTSCESCHTRTTDWNQARFNHFFILTHGPHAGISCVECHLGQKYPVATCTECHAHNFKDMATLHQDVPGWTYDSQACIGCHPTGIY